MIARSDSENIIWRVYNSIKESVVTYQLPPGERLNIELLAEQLRVSTTPVRECLNRLAAEDLIVLVPRVGFFMKTLVESEIRDLYELNRVLLDWSIANISSVDGPRVGSAEIAFCIEKLTQKEPPSKSYQAEALGKLFLCLAQQSGNSEVSLRVRNINDRLRYIRICESDLLKESVEEITLLFQHCRDRQFMELTHALKTYHERRLKMLPIIMRAKSLESRMTIGNYDSSAGLAKLR